MIVVPRYIRLRVCVCSLLVKAIGLYCCLYFLYRQNMEIRWSLLLCVLSLITAVSSTHVDEEITLPSAIITSFSSPVVVFQNSMLQLTCTGVGTLSWYRGNGTGGPVPDNTTELMENNTLIFNMTGFVEGMDATREGLPYFCLASNSLGVARSRAVLVQYTFFNGFQSDNDTNRTINVKLGEAVAMFCNVLPAVPSPIISWYKNESLIDTSTPANKYNLLDDGQYLVIYNLVTSDITNNGDLIKYKCGVTNVRMIETVMSDVEFTLNSTDTFPNNFMAYRLPKSQTLSSSTTSVTFYYIGVSVGGTGVTRLFGSILEVSPGADLSYTLSGAPFNMTKDEDITLALGQGISSNTASAVKVRYTIRDPLTVLQVPLDVLNNTVLFHRFVDESINFTCIATGTDVSLKWYHNGRPLNIDLNTLSLTNLTTNEAGVYQCIWQGSTDEDFSSTSWALAVQIPAPPRAFSFMSDGTTYSGNRTIVPPGTNVTLNLTFQSDFLPLVRWMFTNLTNVTIEIDFVNNPSFEMSSPVLIDVSNEIYQISLTIRNVALNVTGFYIALIDDNRTEVIQSPSWFVSVTVPVEIISFDISPYNCLLENIISKLTCVVRGLPDPIVTFHVNNVLIPCINCSIINSITAVTTSTLEIDATSSLDNGNYLCRANNMFSDGDIDSDNLALVFCTTPFINATTPMVTAIEGGTVQLNCTVSSMPRPSLQDSLSLRWYKGGERLTDDDEHDFRFDNNNVFTLIIHGVRSDDEGTYICFVNNTHIPRAVNASVTLNIMPSATTTPTPSSSSMLIYLGAGIGGGVALIIIVLIIIFVVVCCYCVAKNKKSGNYSTGPRQSRQGLAKDFPDGRGNVDEDSDEEKEEPEAFQPQYESLPALRPAQPPQYKPSPAYIQGYGGGEDFEMMKVPPPDSDFFQGYYPRQDNELAGSIPHGSSMGLQAKYDDFMSEDGQFV